MTGAALILAAVLAVAAPESVSVTASGHTYHRLRAAHVARFELLNVLRAEADSAGYRPCKACFSPRARKVRPFDRLRKP